MYAQYGQDDWVVEMLRGKRGGYFLDTGAADGVRSSNTLLLERNYSWTGICVEPSPDYFPHLRRNRTCRCIEACLWDEVLEVQFLAGVLTLGGVLEDLSQAQIENALRSNGLSKDANGLPPQFTVRTRTIREVLDEAGAPPVIDYWSLDVEGSELRLLKSFPFKRYTFNALTVEHNCLPVRAEIRQLLETAGFECVATLAIDDCYLRSDWLANRHVYSPVWKKTRKLTGLR